MVVVEEAEELAGGLVEYGPVELDGAGLRGGVEDSQELVAGSGDARRL